MKRYSLKTFSAVKSNISAVIAIVAIVIALVQVHNANRASALNALVSTISLFSEPKSRYYELVLRNVNSFSEIKDGLTLDSDTDYLIVLANLYLRDFLQGIEVACGIYFSGFFNEDQRQRIADYVRADIDLLLYGYEEEDGSVRSMFMDNDLIRMDWITPDGNSSDRFQSYISTRECINQWGIELKANSFS